MTRTEAITSVLEETAREHGIEVEELKSSSHRSACVKARIAATKALYQQGLNGSEIIPIINRCKWTVYWYLRKP